MNVRSQPAEAGEEKGSKTPWAGAQMSRSTSAFRMQLPELCGAFIAAGMEHCRSLQEHWSWKWEHNPNSALLYKKNNLTRKPTEINKLLPGLHRDNRD